MDLIAHLQMLQRGKKSKRAKQIISSDRTDGTAKKPAENVRINKFWSLTPCVA